MIDTELFDASGPLPVPIDHARELPLPPAEVFRLWTTPVGLRAVLGVTARVELRIGGPFELEFIAEAESGGRGSEGCQVLCYVPDALLAFTWSAPPHLPGPRARRTWVVVTFESAGGGTRLQVRHLGFGEGPEWAATEAYFQAAWPRFVDAFVRYAEAVTAR